MITYCYDLAIASTLCLSNNPLVSVAMFNKNKKFDGVITKSRRDKREKNTNMN